MSELSRGWTSALLADLVTLRTGPFGTSLHQSDYVSGGIPLVNPMHIVGGRIVPSDAMTVDQATSDRLSEFRLAVGDLVLGRRGEMGRSAVVCPRESGWLCGTGCVIVRPDGRLVRSDYLQRFISSRQVVDYLLAASVGSTMANLNQQHLLSLRVSLPPIREQEAIVALIDELHSGLDGGTAELKFAQAKLQRYRQSLLKAAVQGDLTADWRASNPPAETGADLLQRILVERRTRWEAAQRASAQVSGKPLPKGWQAKYTGPTDLDDADLPTLPDGWVWSTLDMLGEIASGVAKGGKVGPGTPLREVPYLRVANVQRGHLDLQEVKTILASEADIRQLALCEGDVLFNEGGDRDKLGRGWVWRNQVPECIHQNHVFRMRPFLPAMNPEFISHHGNSFGQQWFQSVGKQTTNLASINLGMLRAFPVPVPPAGEQARIAELVAESLAASDTMQAAIDKSLAQCTAQRQNILRAAFAGQLVPQDPSDEPAEVLLARIRASRVDAKPPARKRAARAPAGA